MTTARNALYPHRRNYDGSFDSICRICFATAAHAQYEDALAEQEEKHSCDQSILASREMPSPDRDHHLHVTAA